MIALVMQEITKQKKENERTVRKTSKPVSVVISASAQALLFK